MIQTSIALNQALMRTLPPPPDTMPFPPTTLSGRSYDAVDLGTCLEQVDVIGNLSGAAVVVHDADEGIVFVNQIAAQVLGAPSPDALVGRAMSEFIPPDELRRVDERRRAIDAGLCPDPGEFSIVGLDGTRRTMFVSSARTRFRGRPARVVVARDVTAYRDAEARRARLEEQLAAARRLESLGRLAGGVAHDFNNLLTVIRGCADLALEETGGIGPVGQHLLRIDEATERAASLTRQLLAFGRRQVLRPAVLDLNQVVRDTDRMLRRLIGEDVTVALRLTRQPCPVNADRSQMEQVLMNLVMNARDAMPDGGVVTIETTLEPALHRHGTVEGVPRFAVLTVTDTGAGMDEVTAARIFEPFFSTKSHNRGTGLGLATVYGIVRQSGGVIEVDSSVGVGTTFRIRFPEAPLLQRSGTSDEEDLHPEGMAVDGRRILLVEDDAAIREILQDVLVRAGFVVEAVGDAESALVRLREGGSHDLLITDVILPGLDGAALAEAARGEHPGIRILFISGYTAERLGPKGVGGTEVELLEKPFSPRDLVRRARRILDRDRA